MNFFIDCVFSLNQPKGDVLISVTDLDWRHFQVICGEVWLQDTKKRHVRKSLESIGLCALNMITTLGSIITII